MSDHQQEKNSLVGHDRATERYFDETMPDYSPGRYRAVIRFLRKNAGTDSSLLDIGCGSGSVLKLLADRTPVSRLAGLDVSRAYLERCQAAIPGCRTYLASALDEDLDEIIGERFDYVLLGAMLHHLIGRNRRESQQYAHQALDSAWSLIKPGGALIVMEPTFRPRWAMTVLFHVKRVISRLVGKRVSMLGYWNNLGEPVVSYFSHDSLVESVLSLPGAEIIVNQKKERAVPVLWRTLGITSRSDSVVIAGVGPSISIGVAFRC